VIPHNFHIIGFGEIFNFINTMTKTRKYTATIMAIVALEAAQERKTMSELVSEHGIYSNMIQRWQNKFILRSSELFELKGPLVLFTIQRISQLLPTSMPISY
jgi:transposase-like protein